MTQVTPTTREELADALAESNAAGRSIQLGGAFSKQAMAGPISPADIQISLSRMNRLLQYEPRDLTVSVEAGMPYRELTALLHQNRQMIPLDPPFSEEGTVGGVIAANLNGPRRKLFGTARDMVIGMSYLSVEGKTIQSGGMVVKNVAGLDMAKLMIGSFGTLGVITSVNFRVFSEPEGTCSFVASFPDLKSAVAQRYEWQKSQWQPLAMDLLTPAASTRIGHQGFTLAVQAGGSPAVLKRYRDILSTTQAIEGREEQELWTSIREFTPRFLAERKGAVVRVSHPLMNLDALLRAAPGPVVSRAGVGVLYAYFDSLAEAARWAAQPGLPGRAVVEYGPPEDKINANLWPTIGSDFEIMRRVKDMLDPQGLLNSGRLYGRL